jgi:hypothetical protein
MAGVPAGRLSIELVAEIARLQTDLDKAKRMVSAASGDIAKNSKAANDNIASGFNRTGRSFERLGQQGVQASRSIGLFTKALGALGVTLTLREFGRLADTFSDMSSRLTNVTGSVMAGAVAMDRLEKVARRTYSSIENTVLVKNAALSMVGAFDQSGGLSQSVAGFVVRFADGMNDMKGSVEDFGITTRATIEAIGTLFGPLARLGKSAFDMMGTGADDFRSRVRPLLVEIDAIINAVKWMQEHDIRGRRIAPASARSTLAPTFDARINQMRADRDAKNAALELAEAQGAVATAIRTTTTAASEQSKAYEKKTEAARKFIEQLESELAAVGKSPSELQRMKVATAAAEAPTRALAQRIMEVAEALEEATLLEKFNQDIRNLANMKIVDMGAIGEGWAKERQERIALNDKIKADEIKAAEVTAQRYRDTFRNAAYDFADIVGGTFGRAIAQLAEALERGFSKLAESFGSKISAKLSATLTQMAAGAQIGNATAGLMKGIGIKTSTTGAEIGGALGSAFGPVGAIAGSVLGGVVGGLFKKVKKASATIEIMAGDAVQSSLTGNSSKLKAVAGAMADSLIGGLMGIADQLGGALGDGIRVSIGQRKDTFRVDLSGSGRTKNMPSFKTEEEAVAYAIQEVIRRGAITGLRAGTEALLKGAGDLEAQLQKALAFENVFRELENRANPAKASIDAITKEMSALIDIFDEAKASTEDYARLFELMAMKQREAIEKAFEPIRAMLDDLKGKADQAGEAVKSAFDAVLGREGAAVQAYQDAVAAQAQAQADAAREAFNAGQQRWLSAVTTGFTDEIGRIKDAMGPLRDAAQDFAGIAERLRDFTADALSLDAARFSMAAVNAAAQAGDISALQAQRAAATSTAGSRVEAMRRLAMIRNAANASAGSFEGRASEANAQLAAMERQITAIEEQVELAKSQVQTLESIDNSALDMAALLADMQDATAAADVARAQMALLTELTEVEQSFADAVAAYETAKAVHNDLIREITQAGFADLITVQQQTGSQMIAALASVAGLASQAMADAQASVAAIQAAAKVTNDNAPWMFNGIDLRNLNIPGFAGGGDHAGGLRWVGEKGLPELEATGPSRIMTPDQLMSAGNAELVAEVRALRGEVSQLRAESGQYGYAIAKATAKTTDQLKRWDGDGLPAERDVA